MSERNCYPLHDIPLSAFPFGVNHDQQLLRSIRSMSKPTHGLFVVRCMEYNRPSATINLVGDDQFRGRWLLGRIRQHKSQPGIYEILIRRAKSCYYLAVDSIKDLADEIRFLNIDADAELGADKSEWNSITDGEFHELGFTQENNYGHSQTEGTKGLQA